MLPRMNDMTPAILLCPGQGAQHVGMGKSWAEGHNVARQVFAAADKHLGFALSDLCFDGPAERLNMTDRSQLAIYVTSVACYQALQETAQVDTVAGTAGLSLGEFTALHLAGAFSFEDGLELVKLRGEAMQQAAEASAGSMVALTGEVTEDAVQAVCNKARGEGVLVPANYNSPMQVVVSGSKPACERAVAVASEMGLKPTALQVAGAFHSPLMQPAADRLAEALDKVQWSVPSRPVLSNVTGQPHGSDTATIKRLLVQQLTQPVRWSQSMQWASAHWPGRYVELAPGKVLMGLMRRINRDVRVENFAEAQ